MYIQHIWNPVVEFTKQKWSWSFNYNWEDYSPIFPLSRKWKFFPAALPTSKEYKHKVFQWLNSVKINWDKYMERDKREKEQWLLPPLWSPPEVYEEFHRVWNYPLEHLVWVFDVEDDQTPEKYRKWLPFIWGSEVYHAISWKDITEISDLSENKEYYYTSEIMNALQKWQELHNRWNNPKEKEKMIEEYEKDKRG